MLDKINLKILQELDYNARIPYSKLAKKINISKQNLNYRIKKLIKEKVILGFMSVIDTHKLGNLTYRVYFRYKGVNEEKEKEIISHLKNNENVLWLVSTTGSWDLEAVFIAKNFIHFNNILKKVKEDLGKYFTKYNISMSIVNNHFQRDYLLNKTREEFKPKYYGFEPKQEKLDDLDTQILAELSKDCRQNNQEIGKKLGVTYHTIQNRIKNLESKKIIQAHRILINLEKINRKYFKAFISLNNPTKEEEKKLYSYCSQFNFVVYLVEVLGGWQLEIETEVESQDKLTELLRKIRNEFPDLIIDYNILQVTKEHKLNYFPNDKQKNLKTT
jgi:Lrp/AsnC family transcriptional regulator, regulator for asnA, asnC and gidA